MAKDYTIVIDTREGLPYWIKKIITFSDYKVKFNSESKKQWIDYLNANVKKGYKFGTLNVGDYSIEGYESKLAVERKSLADLYGTLGKGHKRFKAELERSQSFDYFAIVIEGSYSHCKNKSFPGAFYSKMQGYVITKILWTIHMKYKVPFFFTNTRAESRTVIKDMFDGYLSIQ